MKFLRLCALTFLTGVTAGACSPVAAAARRSQQAPPPSVTVAPVEQKEIVEWSEFTGRIEPVESVEVRPRVSGYIQAGALPVGPTGEEGRRAVRD